MIKHQKNWYTNVLMLQNQNVSWRNSAQCNGTEPSGGKKKQEEEEQQQQQQLSWTGADGKLNVLFDG